MNKISVRAKGIKQTPLVLCLILYYSGKKAEVLFMKKRISIILAVVMALLCLAACGQNNQNIYQKMIKLKKIC